MTVVLSPSARLSSTEAMHFSLKVTNTEATSSSLRLTSTKATPPSLKCGSYQTLVMQKLPYIFNHTFFISYPKL